MTVLSTINIPSSSISASIIDTTYTQSTMHVKNSTVEIHGTLVLDGVNVNSVIDDISKMLGVIKRDTKFEEKYPKLKQLYEEYNRTLEYYKTIEILKGNYD